MEKGRISMTDEAAFKLGTNLATTAGLLSMKTISCSLIQYNATTEKVGGTTAARDPAIHQQVLHTDLQPENSFVKYAADQGNTVFIISWINPDKEQSELTWDDYLESAFHSVEYRQASQTPTG